MEQPSEVGERGEGEARSEGAREVGEDISLEDGRDDGSEEGK